jgi:hypothetical protein
MVLWCKKIKERWCVMLNSVDMVEQLVLKGNVYAVVGSVARGA